jgi:hypothetical protein
MPGTTAPPPDEQYRQQQQADEDAAARMIRGEAEMSGEARAQMEVARANQELVRRGDWSLPARHQIDQAQLEVLRATVAKNLTAPEMAMFLEVSARYHLDPFLKHVFAAKFDGANGGVTIFTGRDGLLHAARETGRFVRMQSAVVRKNDVFEVETRLGEPLAVLPEGDPSEGAVIGGVTRLVHKRSGMGDDRGPIVGAYALVWKAGDPEPYYAEAPWSEHGQHRQKDGNGRETTWTVGSRKGFPEQMMRKVPESIALRMCFGITGIVGAEELGDTPERVQNLSDPGAAGGVASREVLVEWGEDDLGRELRELVEVANELLPGSWRPANVAMKINGHDTKAREALRNTLRRFIGQRGPAGREALDRIVVAEVPVEEPPDAEVVEEGGERDTGDLGAEKAEGSGTTDEGDGGREEPQDGPAAVEATGEELPAYDRVEHSRLVDRVTGLREALEGEAAGTLEFAEAEAQLGEALELLEVVNRAAEAAGEQRVDA